MLAGGPPAGTGWKWLSWAWPRAQKMTNHAVQSMSCPMDWTWGRITSWRQARMTLPWWTRHDPKSGWAQTCTLTRELAGAAQLHTAFLYLLIVA